MTLVEELVQIVNELLYSFPPSGCADPACRPCARYKALKERAQAVVKKVLG